MWIRVDIDWDSAAIYGLFAALCTGLAFGADYLRWPLVTALAVQLAVVFGCVAMVIPLLIWQTVDSGAALWDPHTAINTPYQPKEWNPTMTSS